MSDNLNLFALSLSDIIIITLFLTILFTQKSKTQLRTIFLLLLGCICLWVTPLIFKILLRNTNIEPYIFECISGIGNYFAPVLFLLLSEIFVKTKIKLKPYQALFLVIPIISSIFLITNDTHHLLFKSFSENFNEIEYGVFYPVTLIYMYALYVISMGKLLYHSFKDSNIFSKQSIYIIIGSAIPLIINVLGTFNIITITTFTTPISFAITVIFYTTAIFRFNFLKTTPIALQKIVDRMSDGYVILDVDYNITDFNQTFLDTFDLDASTYRGKSLLYFLNSINGTKTEIPNLFKEKLKEAEETTETVIFEVSITKVKKTFSIEINHIFSEKMFIGILVLFKDITQHKQDLETIQNNQNMLIERERLASLGQMVGGIAHSLKTPIFSISGGIEGLSDLIKEFDESIEDPTVNDQDMHDIAKDMNVWIGKMKDHLSYMSEVITTIKGQAVNLSGDDKVDFTISELFSHTNILIKHQLQSALVTLEVQNNVSDDVILSGNVNSLIQVLDNLISNAIQAYTNEENKTIILKADIDYSNENIVITIKDNGPGLPEKVKDKLFKEMITTKGKEGTGLGVFMSYSLIRAKFNGDITYETSSNGTTFNIILPI